MKQLKWFVFICAAYLLLMPQPASAYGVETHAYLTKEAADLYNKSSKNPIPENLVRYLIDGARREDDTPRWLNHFYDPVYDRALTADAAIDAWGFGIRLLGNLTSAKDWALSGAKQSRLINRAFALVNISPLNIASILSAEEQSRISPLGNESDFSWGRALDLYAKGEREKAFFILGHTIHLLEDMSVPDHTRNDPHPDGSPYELYADRFSLSSGDKNMSGRLAGKKLLKKGSVEEYFNSLASYSNGNFLSQNTIGVQSGYSSPTIDLENSKYENGEGYYLKQDGGGSYKLIKTSKIGKVITIAGDLRINPSVSADYWARLSTSAVTHATGLIDLFIKEAEKRKSAEALSGNISSSLPANNNSGIETLPQGAAPQPSIQNTSGNQPTPTAKKPSLALDRLSAYPEEIITRFGSNFTPGARVRISTVSPNGLIKEDIVTTHSSGSWSSSFKLSKDAQKGIYIVIAKDESSGLASPGMKFEVLSRDIVEDPEKEEKVDKPKEEEKPKETKKTVAPKDTRLLSSSSCRYAGTGRLGSKSVIINEIAWMGSTRSASDEWLELKNTSALEIDISGWSLINADEDISVKIAEGTKLAPGKFYLLERSDDDSVPNIKADAFFSGNISNSNESIRLLTADCQIADESAALPSWSAGNSQARKTMERKSDLSWITSAAVNGTPKAENSPGEVVYPTGGGGSSSGSNSGNNNQPPSICRNVTDQPIGKVLINEVAWSGTAKSSSEEWIELYTSSENDISLSGWQLIDAADDIVVNFGPSDKIRGKGYFLLERGSANFISGMTADKFFSGSINNSDEKLFLFAAGCVLSDSVKDVGSNWKNIGGDSGAEKRSAERAGDSWQTFMGESASGIFGTPKAENSRRQPGTSSGTEANHVVISEIMVGESGNPDAEFVELYNPTNSEISIDGWSLRRRAGPEASEDHLISRAGNSLSGKRIAPKSFFLIASPEYAGKNPDARYSEPASANLALNGDIVSVYDESEAKVDEISYGSIASGSSWERMAYSDGVCVDPLGNNEFFGNSCKSLSSESPPLTLRDLPSPQNSENLIEPRPQPTISFSADNFNISFNPSRAEVSADWPADGNMVWKISDGNGVVYSGADNRFTKRASEVGAERSLFIRAKDKDGYAAANAIEKQFSIPRLNEFSFYDSSRNDFGGPKVGSFVDVSFSDFPLFEPGLVYRSNFGDPEDSRYLLVFYKSKPVPVEKYMSADELIGSGAASVCYYSSGSGFGCFPHLSFPEREELPASTAGTYDIDWKKYLAERDRNLSFTLEDRFSEGDYLTVGYYGFTAAGPTPEEKFELLAADNNHILWSASSPPHLRPASPEDFSVTSSPSKQKVFAEIAGLSDADSPDQLLRAEWSADGGNDWVESGNNFETDLSFGERKTISVRAVDDFGLKSDAISVEISAPAIPDGFGEFESVPGGSIGQSFSGASSLSSISLRLVSPVDAEFTSAVSIYDPSDNFAIVGSLSRNFTTGENELIGEYRWSSASPINLDPAKTYYFMVSLNHQAIFFGHQADSVPGNIIRRAGSWTEESGTLKDLWYGLN